MPSKKRAPRKRKVLLPPDDRRVKYVEGVLAGKKKTVAARDAGYSESSANNAKAIIEGPTVQALFEQATRGVLPIDRAKKILDEGLQAETIRHFAVEGQIIDSEPDVDFEQRRKYLELGVKWAGYHIDKQQLDLNVKSENAAERLETLLEAALARGVEPDDASGAQRS